MAFQVLRSSPKAPYILYHHPYSICSIMVRYTFALRGAAETPANEMAVEEQVVEVFQGAQLAEHFLCDINPKGQVPVLYNAKLLSKPLADSLYITLYIADRYPSLLPAAHGEQILYLLRELHDVNYFSISFGTKPAVANEMKAAIGKLLARGDLSHRYRDALVFKLKVQEEEKVHGVTEAKVYEEVGKTKSLLAKVDTLLDPAAGPWLFGLSAATALDASLIPFLARLREVGRAELVSEGLSRYADAAMAAPEWESVMEGRKTMVSV